MRQNRRKVPKLELNSLKLHRKLKEKERKGKKKIKKVGGKKGTARAKDKMMEENGR